MSPKSWRQQCEAAVTAYTGGRNVSAQLPFSSLSILCLPRPQPLESLPTTTTTTTIFRLGLPTSGCSGNTQRCVSMVTLSPVRLTARADHHGQLQGPLLYLGIRALLRLRDLHCRVGESWGCVGKGSLLHFPVSGSPE